jgi:hypothetical protein
MCEVQARLEQLNGFVPRIKKRQSQNESTVLLPDLVLPIPELQSQNGFQGISDQLDRSSKGDTGAQNSFLSPSGLVDLGSSDGIPRSDASSFSRED